MDVLLVGGPRSLDGLRKQVDDAPGHRDLEFYEPSKDNMVSPLDFTRQNDLDAAIHKYRIQQISVEGKQWWFGIHNSITVQEAFEKLYDNYP